MLEQALKVRHIHPPRVLTTTAALVAAPPASATSRSRLSAKASPPPPPPPPPPSSHGRHPRVEGVAAGAVVYADSLLSLHATTPLDRVAVQQLARLRDAALGVAGAGADGRHAHADPVDDLVIVIRDAPLDAGPGGTGTVVASW
jgi:hypothetical protein